jgi:GTP-binding protein HflX
MKELIEIKKDIESVVLVGLITEKQSEEELKEYLDELSFLVETAGGNEIKRFVQRLKKADSRSFVGTGKLREIAAYCKENEIDTVVFDDELSPSQIRNIEQVLKIKILDRNNLILDIFASRARTADAKKQVELAQYEYLLPRLTRMWTHLERQKGGIGMKGPGEKEIETDRRVIRDKIALLKKQLQKIDKQKATQRKNRGKIVRLALVGYTNVGKSTIMNLLAKTDVFAENKLFATLDTTVRKIVIDNLPFLLSDTVGFIRKLPHALIESFKSTLDEVRESDILIHVVDISHSNFYEQMETVNQTLEEIGAADKTTILLFNKIDAYPEEEKTDELEEENIPKLVDFKRMWLANSQNPTVFISAKEKTNVEEMKQIVYNKVKEIHTTRYPYNDFLY